jgi:hypothetical protein
VSLVLQNILFIQEPRNGPLIGSINAMSICTVVANNQQNKAKSLSYFIYMVLDNSAIFLNGCKCCFQASQDKPVIPVSYGSLDKTSFFESNIKYCFFKQTPTQELALFFLVNMVNKA